MLIFKSLLNVASPTAMGARLNSLLWAGLALALVPTISMAQDPVTAEPAVTFGGEIRGRVQRSYDDAKSLPEQDKTNLRLRARLAAAAKVNEQVTAGLRLTTGSTGVSGVTSANQTFSGFGRKHDFNLDLAYLSYAPMTNLAFQFGKTPNIFWTAGKNEIVWDGDVPFDGLNMKYVLDLAIAKPWFAATYAQLTEETDPGVGNVFPIISMAGGQVGLPITVGEFEITSAVSYYTYNNIKGFPTAALGGNNGAETTGAGFANEYAILSGDLEIGYELEAAPLSLAASYATNTLADKEEVATWAGIRLGKLKDQGDWMVQAGYRDVGRNAVFPLYTDSDFLGGGTDAFGNEYRAGYQWMDNLSVGATYYAGRKFNATRVEHLPNEVMIMDVIGRF